MELYFLDADFSVLCGPCDSFTSAVFRERFFSVGSFEIHLPLSEWSLIRDAVYVRTGYEGGECLCGPESARWAAKCSSAFSRTACSPESGT